MSEEFPIERKKVLIYLVEEGSQQVETALDFDLESNKPPSLKFTENRMQIGYGEWHKQVSGSIELDVVIAGDYWMSNAGGMLRMKGVIPK